MRVVERALAAILLVAAVAGTAAVARHSAAPELIGVGAPPPPQAAAGITVEMAALPPARARVAAASRRPAVQPEPVSSPAPEQTFAPAPRVQPTVAAAPAHRPARGTPAEPPRVLAANGHAWGRLKHGAATVLSVVVQATAGPPVDDPSDVHPQHGSRGDEGNRAPGADHGHHD